MILKVDKLLHLGDTRLICSFTVNHLALGVIGFLNWFNNHGLWNLLNGNCVSKLRHLRILNQVLRHEQLILRLLSCIIDSLISIYQSCLCSDLITDVSGRCSYLSDFDVGCFLWCNHMLGQDRLSLKRLLNQGLEGRLATIIALSNQVDRLICLNQ